MTTGRDSVTDESQGHSPPDAVRVHGVALALAVDADGPLFGVLIVGPAGAGKSMLAIRAIGRCRWHRTALVADDVVSLTVRGGALEATAPAALAGRLEVRGYGPVAAIHTPSASLGLVIGLNGRHERTPPTEVYVPEGIAGAHRLRLVDPPVWLPFRADAPAAAERLVATARTILMDKFATRRTIDRAPGGP